MGQCLVQLHCEMNAPAGCSPRSQHTVGRRRWVTLGNREMPSALVATSHLYQMCQGLLSIRRHPVTPQALSALPSFCPSSGTAATTATSPCPPAVGGQSIFSQFHLVCFLIALTSLPLYLPTVTGFPVLLITPACQSSKRLHMLRIFHFNK